mgnify:CR=1 FL=1
MPLFVAPSTNEFQSPKSGHIVCNVGELSYTGEIGKFQSPKSGHIVCNF